MIYQTKRERAEEARRIFSNSEFKEEDHPRGDDGKFGKGGGGGYGKTEVGEKKKDTEVNNFNKDSIETIHGKFKIPQIAKEAKEQDFFENKEIERFNKRFDEGEKIKKKYNGKTEYEIWNEMSQEEIDLYSNLGPVSEAFFLSGLRGEPSPRFTTGWRFGRAPDSGKSINYAENRPEKGVSFMETRESDKIKGMYELLSKKETKPFFYAGYELYSKGSDGEPLMVGLKEIKSESKEYFNNVRVYRAPK